MFFTGEPLLVCLRFVKCRFYTAFICALSVNIAVCAVYARVIPQYLRNAKNTPLPIRVVGGLKRRVIRGLGSRRGIRGHVCLVGHRYILGLLRLLLGCTDMEGTLLCVVACYREYWKCQNTKLQKNRDLELSLRDGFFFFFSVACSPSPFPSLPLLLLLPLFFFPRCMRDVKNVSEVNLKVSQEVTLESLPRSALGSQA